jgi:alanyl-tRNA synthetase
MSSERLYYEDAYLMEFDAVVRDVVKQGDLWKVTLDRTAFYPTSGGQPFDVGTLDGAKVSDVVDQEDGNIGHLVDRELEKNTRVRGHVDWNRRFDHMQQHTGQHLLSAGFEREVGAKTVSFHLGTATSTIDLDREVAADRLAAVEETVNKVLWEDREVCIRFVSASEAAKLPLRKDPGRAGDLRIIEIKDFDLSACGGTHVRRTGAVGMIAVRGYERFKGGLRVEFVCGHRALRAFRALNAAVGGSVRLLSVLPEDLAAAIERLQIAGRNQQKTQEALYERLASYEAIALRSQAEKIGPAALVATVVTGWDANGLKNLASALVDHPASVAVLLGSESPFAIAVARSRDLSFDSGDVVRKLLERFGGKGGGKGAMAQGGGLTGDTQEILRAAREQLTSMIGGQ